MINHYEIKKSNKEEVLILYLDINEEFSLSFKDNNKYKEFKYGLKKIIDIEKFKGKRVILVVGGIIIGSLLFLNTPVDKETLENYIFVDNSIAMVNNIENLEENIEPEVNDKEIIKVEEIKKEDIKNKTEENILTNNTENHNSQNQSKNENKNHNEIENVKNDQIIEKEEIMVTVHRSKGSIITLTMNDYLIGVIGAEMPASFNIEALKAQAVLSRTYALKKIENNQKLTDTVSTQRYKDNNELKSMWGNDYQKYYTKIKEAVESTDNITLKYKGNYIDAVYHSTSNGKTEDAVNVWGNSVEYLKSVDSSWDQDASSYLRTENKDLNNILNLLGINNENINFEIISRNKSGRVETIKVGDNIFTGVEFRNLLGLRSADFDINVVNNEIIITTRGYGHGVGMSQYGANGMANTGYNYSQILKHYYPGTYEEKI